MKLLSISRLLSPTKIKTPTFYSTRSWLTTPKRFTHDFSNRRAGPYDIRTVYLSPKREDFEVFSINGGKEDRRKAALAGQSNRPKVEGRVIFLGCGAVALCCLDLFERLIDLRWEQVTLIDMLDLKNSLNIVFEKYCSAGDLVIDLTVDSGSLDFMKWCIDNKVSYINSSVEAWHSDDPSKFDPVKQCQFYEFDSTEIWKQHLRRSQPNANTVIYGLGANPGLVNLFVKQNIEDVAKYYLQNNDADTSLAQSIHKYLSNNQFNKLAQTLGVKTIHISELDSQITDPKDQKKPGECVNTWSIDGMYYEWIFLRSEIAWGTHEKHIPEGGHYVAVEPYRGQSNVVLLPERGKDAAIKSWTPGRGEYVTL
jgi:homospermidine synthase